MNRDVALLLLALAAVTDLVLRVWHMLPRKASVIF